MIHSRNNETNSNKELMITKFFEALRVVVRVTLVSSSSSIEIAEIAYGPLLIMHRTPE